MTSLSNLAIKAVVEGYDFSDIETLVDVAGGHGRLLTAILEASTCRCTACLFDQPHVIAGAKDNEHVQGVTGAVRTWQAATFSRVCRRASTATS